MWIELDYEVQNFFFPIKGNFGLGAENSPHGCKEYTAFRVEGFKTDLAFVC